MSETKVTVVGELLDFAKKVLGAQALGTIIIAGFAVFGYRALAAEARDGGAVAAQEVAREVALLKTEVERSKAVQLEQARDAAEAKRRLERVEVLGIVTDANMRLVMQRLGVQPVTIDPSKDGGQ